MPDTKTLQSRSSTRAARDRETYLSNTWKPIPGMPEYEASCTGLIARTAPAKTRTVPCILRLSLSSRGYPRCKLMYQGHKSTQIVSRLVLLAWVGYPPRGKDHACHNDGNPQNNSIDNLRWDSCSGNFADKKKHGTSTSGARNGRAVMTWNKVRQMREAYSKQPSKNMAAISRSFGLSYSQTREIIKEESWHPDDRK